MEGALFYVFSAVAVLSALMVIVRKNPVVSALFLVLTFFCVAGIYLLLNAQFIAAVQIIVYAGAIMVLFLFVLMLLNLSPEELKENISRSRKVVAALGSVVLFALLATAIYTSPTVQTSPGAADLVSDVAEVVTDDVYRAGETAGMASSLFKEHVLPFELTSILILVAIIGAIYLTKSRRRSHKRRRNSGQLPFWSTMRQSSRRGALSM